MIFATASSTAVPFQNSSKRFPNDCYRVADSQVASRWGNITNSANSTRLLPMTRYFSLLPIRIRHRPLVPRSMIRPSVNFSFSSWERGFRHAAASAMNGARDSFFVIDSFVDRLVDAVGAGDALLLAHGGTLAMLIGKNPVIATILGSMAAACECEVDGNSPVTPDDVGKKSTSLKSRPMVLKLMRVVVEVSASRTALRGCRLCCLGRSSQYRC